MNLFKKSTLLGLFCLSSQLLATPGEYEINQACVNVGCFSGDNPATSTIEITKTSGTFRLTSDIFVGAGDPGAIVVDGGARESIITIDLNGFQIINTSFPTSNVSAISIVDNNSFVTIKNGSIRSFNDGINAVRSAFVDVDNMVFRLMADDAIQAGRGRISNSSFDCNAYGVNALSVDGNFVGDRLYLENNEFTCLTSNDDQQPVFGMGATNVCKDNRIMYAANANNFGQCLLVGSNICNTAVCTQARAIDATNESKE